MDERVHQDRGVLAIWNNVRDGLEAAFEGWYHQEHLLERVGVPGIRYGRRYEAVHGDPGYFCYYVTDTPEVLSSRAYLDRLNDPTPLTREIMSNGFRDMVRTVCRRVAVRGHLQGAYAVTVRFDGQGAAAGSFERVGLLLEASAILRCEHWVAVDVDVDRTIEEQLRGGDDRIAGCLLLETARLQDAERACGQLEAGLASRGQLGIYRLLSEARADDGG